MEERELLKRIAPCGMACYTCAAARDGVIRAHSVALLNLLESFDKFARAFSAHEPALTKYPDFKQVLLLFANADCEGCRDGKCIYPGCPISPCINDKEYDYCFECQAFPCEKADSDRRLKEKWMTCNLRMREIGVEAYFDEVKDRSHYA